MKKYIHLFMILSTCLVLLLVGVSITAVGYLFPDGCFEGPVSDGSASNARGDVASDYIKVCTAFGSFADFSIVFRRHDEAKTVTLIEYGDFHAGYPKLRWINDDSLSIDLGQIHWVRRKVKQVGSLHIAYSYTYADDFLSLFRW